MKVDQLKCRIRLKSAGSPKNDRARPASPSLQFAQPQPMAATPRPDTATDEGHGDIEDAGDAIQKTDPKKVADRVYELMQRELVDARIRGGAGRKR